MRNFVYIAIVGSIQNLTEEELSSKIETIKERVVEKNGSDTEIVLIHGFATKEFLENKGIDTVRRDIIDSMFPIQIPFFHNNTCDREYFKEILDTVSYKASFETWVVTDPNENVQHEINIAESYSAIIYLDATV